MTDSRAGQQPLRSNQTLVIRPGRPRLRTTFQFKGRIAPSPELSLEETWAAAARLCLGWLSSKYAFPLPDEAKRLEPFLSEEPGQALRCISLEKPRLWAVRLEQPDTPFRGRAAVPGRSWITDLSVAATETEIFVGVRVQCASLAFADQPIVLTRPRIILELAKSFVFPGQRRILGKPWVVRSDELLELRDYLESPRRAGPAFFLTQPDAERLGLYKVRPFLLDADALAQRVQGLATVVCLERRVGFEWTALVGKEWSAYLGSVRTYLPRLRLSEDSPYAHPLARAERVLATEFNGLTAEPAFEAFLEQVAFREAAEQQVAWTPSLLFPDARNLRADQAREAAGEDADWREIYEESIATLKDKIKQAEAEAEDFNNDALAERRRREGIEEENRKLRAYADTLRSALEHRQERSADSALEIPDNYADLPDWAAENLVGRLVIHPRAARGAKEGRYERPDLVYAGLLLLAREYRAMRLGEEGGKVAFDAKCKELGLECGGSIAESRAGAEGDQYYVRYPIGTDHRCFLASHLSRGTSRDESRALRIYFFWDDATNQVVVGWLPSHLDNQLT